MSQTQYLTERARRDQFRYLLYRILALASLLAFAACAALALFVFRHALLLVVIFLVCSAASFVCFIAFLRFRRKAALQLIESRKALSQHFSEARGSFVASRERGSWVTRDGAARRRTCEGVQRSRRIRHSGRRWSGRGQATTWP